MSSTTCIPQSRSVRTMPSGSPTSARRRVAATGTGAATGGGLSRSQMFATFEATPLAPRAAMFVRTGATCGSSPPVVLTAAHPARLRCVQRIMKPHGAKRRGCRCECFIWPGLGTHNYPRECRGTRCRSVRCEAIESGRAGALPPVPVLSDEEWRADRRQAPPDSSPSTRQGGVRGSRHCRTACPPVGCV